MRFWNNLDAVLVRPGAGRSVNVPVGPAARVELGFNQDEAVLVKEAQNLVFTFHDGGKLVLEGFYDHCLASGQSPALIFWDSTFWNAGYWG